ncbi:hypothetical protein [Methylogaea oryzae]|uniref:hypothetical protein n=1 Tax=Methylogaea oryzae TaxID=1295382 RepID=UPI003570E871
MYSKRNKERVSEDAYMSMSKQVRDPLGSIGQRLLVSAGTPDEVNGVRGPFVFHTYQADSATRKTFGPKSCRPFPRMVLGE